MVSKADYQTGRFAGERNENISERRPLPLPGQGSDRSKETHKLAKEDSYVVDDEHTILPPYAPFADGSIASSTAASQAQSPIDPQASIYSEGTGPSSTMNSGYLSESYIRV